MIFYMITYIIIMFIVVYIYIINDDLAIECNYEKAMQIFDTLN